jgi:serine/threonine protein kinase
MVWATFGCHGLEEFRSQRLATTKTIAGFKDGNCFHDGWNRLEIVDDWLDHVVEESQKKARDNISPNLAHLVRLMLDADPKCRPDTKSIYHWTEQYIFKATKKLQQHEGTNASNRLAQPPPNTPPSPPSRPTYSVGGSQDQTRSSYQWQNSPDSSIAIGSSPPTSPVVGSEQRYSQYNNSTTSAGPPNSHNSYQSDYNLALLSHTRPLSDPFDSNNDLSLSSPTSAVGSLSLQRNPISLDTVLERGVQTQKAPIPLWPINDAIFWREQRRGQKGSIHTFSKVFVPDPDKDKFADVDGSKDLQELNARDHVSFIENVLPVGVLIHV